jgi:hypothetical protein
MKNGIPIVKGDHSHLHRAAKPLPRGMRRALDSICIRFTHINRGMSLVGRYLIGFRLVPSRSPIQWAGAAASSPMSA